MNRTPHPERIQQRRLRVAGILGVLILAAWFGCSPEKNYELLSFFFDGVPDPSAPVLTEDGTMVPAGPLVSIHPPFAEEQCRKCHTDLAAGMLSRSDGSVCLQCHADIPTQNAVVHGAVAGLACLWCHDPHQSRYEHLLRGPAPDLCNQCHVQEAGTESPGASSISAHASAQTDCLECHFGHGGESEYFLRNGIGEKEMVPEPDHAPVEENSADAL